MVFSNHYTFIAYLYEWINFMPLGLKFQINHLIRLTRISDMDYNFQHATRNTQPAQPIISPF